MKAIIAAAFALISSSAFANVVDTVQCPDGSSHKLSYYFKGQGVPGYFVSAGRYWTARASDSQNGTVDFYNGEIDGLTCAITSTRKNP